MEYYPNYVQNLAIITYDRNCKVQLNRAQSFNLQPKLFFNIYHLSSWFRLIRLDLTNKENMLFFVCREVFKSKLVKMETSHTVILPPPPK